MPHNNFSDTDFLATVFAVLAGVWGAILSFLKRDTNGLRFLKKLSYFLMDMFVNTGLTLLTYIGLIGYGINDLMAVAAAGYIAHLGTRSFYLIEILIADKLGSKAMLEEIRKDDAR